ncbi:MAG: DUF362 domain-containing protein [Planctomycetota bacterium]
MEDNEHKMISRRKLLKWGTLAGSGLFMAKWWGMGQDAVNVRDYASSGLRDGIAIVHGNAGSDEEESDVVRKMTRAAVDALGGMEKLVQSGQTVYIKPNIAWMKPPEMGANTNPWVVAALVEMCRNAGASHVRVMDHTISPNPEPSYAMSGIADAAGKAGADILTVEEDRFREMPIPDALALEQWYFYEDFISPGDCDVLINVPVLKDHGTSRLTIGMKNVFGMVGGERGDLHRNIHRKMADLNRLIRIDLTVMDAYRVMRDNGPTGGRPQDVDNSRDGARRIVAGTDVVAVDAYGASMFDYSPEDVGFIKYGAASGVGRSDWENMVVEENTV